MTFRLLHGVCKPCCDVFDAEGVESSFAAMVRKFLDASIHNDPSHLACGF